MSTSVSGDGRAARRGADVTTFSIILALSFSHFLNDTMQSLVPAIYPMLKGSYGLSFAQVGLITLTMQTTSSLLQPAVERLDLEPAFIAVELFVTELDRRRRMKRRVRRSHIVDVPAAALEAARKLDVAGCGFREFVAEARRRRLRRYWPSGR